MYKDYEIDVTPQAVDKADGTFKTAKATAQGKNKYVGVLGVLLMGSFVIPMLQYFWYVREE
jgi:formate-dependent nitrite reductase membrane component NrfD